PLKALRSYQDDHHEYLAQMEVLRKRDPMQAAPLADSPEPSLRQVETVFKKYDSEAHGAERVRVLLTSRSLIVATLVCVVSFTILPVPFVFSFFDKSLTAVKSA